MSLLDEYMARDRVNEAISKGLTEQCSSRLLKQDAQPNAQTILNLRNLTILTVICLGLLLALALGA